MTGPQLYRLATSAEYLLQGLLLLDLGLDADKIASLFRRNTAFAYFVGQIPTLS
jgi:hypothetical protein